MIDRDAGPIDDLGAFDGVAVDVDVFARQVARAVAGRVVEDGEQPRAQVRARRQSCSAARKAFR